MSSALLPTLYLVLLLIDASSCMLTSTAAPLIPFNFTVTRNYSMAGLNTRAIASDSGDRLYFSPSPPTVDWTIPAFDVRTGQSLPPIQLSIDAQRWNISKRASSMNMIKADRRGALHVHMGGYGVLAAIDPSTNRWLSMTNTSATQELSAFDVDADGSRYVLCPTPWLSQANISVVSVKDGSTLFTLPIICRSLQQVAFNKANGHLFINGGGLGSGAPIAEYSTSGVFIRNHTPQGGRGLQAYAMQACDDGSLAVLYSSSAAILSTDGQLSISAFSDFTFFTDALAVDRHCNVTGFVTYTGVRPFDTRLVTLSPYIAAASPLQPSTLSNDEPAEREGVAAEVS